MYIFKKWCMTHGFCDCPWNRGSHWNVRMPQAIAKTILPTSYVMWKQKKSRSNLINGIILGLIAQIPPKKAPSHLQKSSDATKDYKKRPFQGKKSFQFTSSQRYVQDSRIVFDHVLLSSIFLLFSPQPLNFIVFELPWAQGKNHQKGQAPSPQIWFQSSVGNVKHVGFIYIIYYKWNIM